MKYNFNTLFTKYCLVSCAINKIDVLIKEIPRLPTTKKNLVLSYANKNHFFTSTSKHIFYYSTHSMHIDLY